jgi:uncharacterized protein
MKFARLRLSFSLAALLCVAVAGQAAEPSAAKHFFWKVGGGKGTVYLLGTVHLGNKDLYPLPSVIEDSFKEADTLVEEIDLNSSDAKGLTQDFLKRGLYLDGDTVTNHLGDETKTALAAYVKSGKLDANYTHAKPWLLSLLIMQIQLKEMELDSAKGLDLHFSEEAAALHKPVTGLETADFQINLFSTFSDELQDQLLLTTLLDAQKGKELLQRTLEAWRSGDTGAMEAAITAETREHPSLEPVMDKLFYERNDAMTQQIDKFLQTPKVYFVAVGAGHLVGQRGILSQLRDKNYTIERP